MRPHSELRWKPVRGSRARQGWVLAGPATSSPAGHQGARMQDVHFIQINTEIFNILKNFPHSFWIASGMLTCGTCNLDCVTEVVKVWS